jgi:DNA-binding MarR family transcriptional regulator
MTLHQLRIFMAVAQSSTLTRASKQLGLAQPSLSQQLAKLEESVGTRLFDRSHNRMVLTDAGQVLVRHAQAVLKEIDEAEASLRQFSSGKRSIIRIAGLNSVVKAVQLHHAVPCKSGFLRFLRKPPVFRALARGVAAFPVSAARGRGLAGGKMPSGLWLTQTVSRQILSPQAETRSPFN